MNTDEKFKVGKFYMIDKITGEETEISEVKEVSLSSTPYSDTPRGAITAFTQTECTLTGAVENVGAIYDIIIDSLKKNTLLATEGKYDMIVVNNEGLARLIKEKFGMVNVVVNEHVTGILFYNSEIL